MEITWLELVKVIIIGIVEGITEWLPISSTGHMILVDEFIRLDVSHAFMEMFLVVIQLGAILAVVVLNFKKLNPFTVNKDAAARSETFSLWAKVIVSCLPAGVIGLLFNDYMEEHFMNVEVVVATLIVYGVLFIIVERINRTRNPRIATLNELDYKTAFIIGCFQVLSLVPGTSRSGATILGGILFGTSRLVAAEFTFFLAIPVMLGASVLKLFRFGFNYSGAEIITLLVGMVTAFIVSILSIKFLLQYIKNNDFTAFGYYRIALGILVLTYLFIFGNPI